MYKEHNVRGGYLTYGTSWHSFSLGINISRYSIDLNLGFVWIGYESYGTITDVEIEEIKRRIDEWKALGCDCQRRDDVRAPELP